MKTFAILVAVVLLVASVAGGSWYALQNFDEEIVYEEQEIRRGDVESTVVATGALEPVNTVIVGTEVSGQISELLVDFNDTVEQGQVIARIDPRTFEARRQQRTADVEVANANIISRNAELTRANSNLRRARRELERREDLSQDGHVSVSELENDRNVLDQALAAVEIAQASITNAEAGLIQAKASLAQADLDLDRTYVRSPISGTVINRAVEIGQTVAASFSAPELFVIAHDLHEMKVEASVDEADIGRLSEGLPARFSVDAYPDREFNGRITQIRKSPTATQNVVTFKVVITARNDDLSLFPGMTANVEMVLGSRQDVLTVPISALLYSPRGVAADSAAETGAQGGGSGFGGSAGGQRRGPMSIDDQVQFYRSRLALSDDQQKLLKPILEGSMNRMRAMFAGGGAGGPRGFGGTGMRQRMTNLMESTNEEIAGILNADQRVQFEQMNASRGGTRQTVYFLNEQGQEEQRSVMIGLQDENLAEVLSGIDEGEQVITRARRITS